MVQRYEINIIQSKNEPKFNKTQSKKDTVFDKIQSKIATSPKRKHETFTLRVRETNNGDKSYLVLWGIAIY